MADPRSRPFVQNACAALAYLRGQRISVSVARQSMFGTWWWVSGYGRPFNAAGLVDLAIAKGWQP